MSALARRWLPLALLALAALWLRTHDFASRPMHADEANQAVKLGELLESGRYAFDPRDHHGPTLYYAAVPIAWLRGEHTLASLTETTVRLVPALAGTLSVILLYLLLSPPAPEPQTQNPKPKTSPPLPTQNSKPRTQNQGFPLLAAAFLAVSPPAVYYSRYFIQETLLLTFTLATFVCVQRWWRRGTTAWALATGICVGLMLATKASAPLFLLAALVAFVVARPHSAASLAALPPAHHLPRAPLVRALVLAFVAALLTAALFYSSLGTHLTGLRDALSAYGFASHRLAGATGHEKPWWYYARLFIWREDGGLVFQQLAFTALALAGATLAVLPRHRRLSLAPSPRPAPHPSPSSRDCHIIDDTSGGPLASASPPSDASSPVLRTAALYTFLIAFVLSVTPYKTPWHAVHLVPGLAVLAAATLVAIPRPWLAALFAIAVLWLQLAQTRLTVFLRPADARNPYAYVHSSPDVLKVRPLADAALARQPNGVIRIIGEEYWPLPWYLRGIPRVGYWSTAPDDCDAALILASVAQADAVRARLHGDYHESLLGLRPGFLCVVFTPTGSAVPRRVP